MPNDQPMAEGFVWGDRTPTLADLAASTGWLRDALVAAQRQDAWPRDSGTAG